MLAYQKKQRLSFISEIPPGFKKILIGMFPMLSKNCVNKHSQLKNADFFQCPGNDYT